MESDPVCHWVTEKADQVKICEPEDLPVVCAVDHGKMGGMYKSTYDTEDVFTWFHGFLR